MSALTELTEANARASTIIAQQADEMAALQRRVNRLEAILSCALLVLEEHAEDERSFWGEEDKHGLAREAEQIYEAAKAALAGRETPSS